MSEVDSIAALARKDVIQPTVVTAPDGRAFLVTPTGVKQSEITNPYGQTDKLPLYAEADAVLDSAESFADFANNFSEDGSTVFADAQKGFFRFIGDYHTRAHADRCAFNGRYTLQETESWCEWVQFADGSMTGQLAFLRFIEEHQEEIVSPDQATLRETLRDFHAVRQLTVQKVVREQFGVESFTFKDETKVFSVELPTVIKAVVPVFYNTAPIMVEFLLRWKINDNQDLMLGLKLKTKDEIRREVFEGVAAVIRSGLDEGIRFYFGNSGTTLAQADTFDSRN